MGRLRGFLWLVAGLVVAALAALIAFTTLSRAAAQRAGQEVVGPQVQVAVAAHTVAVRAALTAEDVQVITVPVEMAPEGAIGDAAAAVGKVTLVDLNPGEILLAQRLIDPNITSGDGRRALIVTGEDVLMALPADDLMSQVGLLKPGDHVDLLYTLDFPAANTGSETEGNRTTTQEDTTITFNVLQNLTIAGITGDAATGNGAADELVRTSNADSGGPAAILFTVSSQDALVLKRIKDAGAILDIVVRAPGNDSPTTAEPVDLNYVVNRYRIPGVSR